jgi:hypothetical protein
LTASGSPRIWPTNPDTTLRLTFVDDATFDLFGCGAKLQPAHPFVLDIPDLMEWEVHPAVNSSRNCRAQRGFLWYRVSITTNDDISFVIFSYVED